MWDGCPHQHSPRHPPPPCLELEDSLRIKGKTPQNRFTRIWKRKKKFRSWETINKKSTKGASQGGWCFWGSLVCAVTTARRNGAGGTHCPFGQILPIPSSAFPLFWGTFFPTSACSHEPLNAWAAGVQPHTSNPPSWVTNTSTNTSLRHREGAGRRVFTSCRLQAFHFAAESAWLGCSSA